MYKIYSRNLCETLQHFPIDKPLSKCIIIYRNHLQNFASDVLGSLQAILVASPVSIMNMMNMDDMQRRVLLSGMDLLGGGGGGGGGGGAAP
jgi:hypothetical protein